ncbi:MAG: hypothetical protein K5657_01430 [Desulfovibrio sp.]|nr:hypothetical protein [Desulfovibrio sp.]
MSGRNVFFPPYVLLFLPFLLFFSPGILPGYPLFSAVLSPSAFPVFSPDNPGEHATWKGRRSLPLEEMRLLCRNVSLYLGVHPEYASVFLLEIAAAESDFGYYVRQVKGPAQSVWQIEPATANDTHARLSRRNPLLYKKIVQFRNPNLSEEDNVVTNLEYGCALCIGVLTLKGIRFSTLTSLEKRAEAWKRYYNTYLGKGTLEGYCQKAMRYVGSSLSQGRGVWEDAFDEGLMRSGHDLFASRNRERYLELPPGFDESPMGRYYKQILRERPEVFEQVPSGVLKSKNVQSIMGSLLLELVRKVQENPASIGEYADMPDQIFKPLVSAAMAENAFKAYPNLPVRERENPEMRKLYEAQKLLLERLPGLMPQPRTE